MDTNDDEEDDFTKYQPSITDDKENFETEDTIDPAKPSPSDASQTETTLLPPTDEVPIVATKAAVFPSDKVPASL